MTDISKRSIVKMVAPDCCGRRRTGRLWQKRRSSQS